MADLFPHYDVLAKRDTLSWDHKTREAVDARLALAVDEAVLTPAQLRTLTRVVERICPDPDGRPPTTTLAIIVDKIARDESDGYRHHLLPSTAACWRRGLDTLDREALGQCGASFSALSDADADLVLGKLARGDVKAEEWRELPPKLFWQWRLIPDCVSAHWAQPSLWSAMGFGGPASPRGYVRLAADRRDPWEAEEAGEKRKGLPRHRG